MKMRRVFLMFLPLFVGIFFTACATKPIKLDQMDKNPSELPLKEQYDLGYAQAIKDNKDAFIDKGFQDAMKILESLLKHERALCSGKYAIEESLVTQPLVTAIEDNKSNRGMNIKIIGCKIDRRVTPEKMLQFYSKYHDVIPTLTQQQFEALQNSDNTNFLAINSLPSSSTTDKAKEDTNPSLRLSSTKKKINFVQEPSHRKDTNTVRIPKNSSSDSILARYNFPTIEKESHYEIPFPTKKLADDFCRVTQQCIGNR